MPHTSSANFFLGQRTSAIFSQLYNVPSCSEASHISMLSLSITNRKDRIDFTPKYSCIFLIKTYCFNLFINLKSQFYFPEALNFAIFHYETKRNEAVILWNYGLLLLIAIPELIIIFPISPFSRELLKK